MHPDRRRHGRAIRKQRRDARRIGTLNVFLAADLTAFNRVIEAATVTMQQFSQSVDAVMRAFALEARFWAVTAPYFPSSATFERLDMSTVSITAPASAPDDLKDHLRSFAAELNEEGITATLEFVRTCIACGCTDEKACFLGCWWATPAANLCSSCDTPENRARVDEIDAQRERRNLLRAPDAETATTKGGE